MRLPMILILALLTLTNGLSSGPLFQASDGVFIAETGHWIKGEFFDFWQQAKDPTLVFGYPITDVIPHPIMQNVTVQYFQRARFDLDATKPTGQRISLAPLGERLYNETERGDRANFSINNTACRVFPATSHNVCYAFLQFYDRHNGPVFFGQPISEVETVDGRLVQYFEHTRMEWRPERPAGQRVVLTEVGRIDFDITIGDRNLQSTYTDIPQGALTEMKVYAFAAKPLMATGGEQKVYVIVYDQFLQPIEDVQVMMTVQYPGGRNESFRPEQHTGEDGLAEAVFTVDNVHPNEVVQVQVDASIPNGPTGQTSTWFRIWW